MDSVINQICYCIRNYMNKTGDELIIPQSLEEWETLYSCSIEQNIPGIVYDSVRKIREFALLPQDFKITWKNMVMFNVASQMRTDEAFGVIYDEFINSGIVPLVVKGAVCRCLYDNPEFRISGDEDILIKIEDYDKSHRILKEKGFVFDEDSYNAGLMGKESEITYQSPNKDLTIELHIDLFEKDNEVYSSFNKWFENVFDHPTTVIYKNRELYTLSYTDHFLYLCCHAYKHFVHSGFGIRPVMDIIAMADKYAGDIDWTYIWSKLKETIADILFMNIFYIGEKYFGVSMEKFGGYSLIYSDGRSEGLLEEKELLSDLFMAGVHGRSSIDRVQSSLMTLDAVKNQDTSINKSRIKALFPGVKEISGRYKFLKRFPFLLPVAWIMRITVYLKEQKNSEGSIIKENKSSQIGGNRIRLLEKYKVIQK